MTRGFWLILALVTVVSIFAADDAYAYRTPTSERAEGCQACGTSDGDGQVRISCATRRDGEGGYDIIATVVACHFAPRPLNGVQSTDAVQADIAGDFVEAPPIRRHPDTLSWNGIG